MKETMLPTHMITNIDTPPLTVKTRSTLITTSHQIRNIKMSHVLVWKPTTWANEDEQCGTQLEIVRDVVDDAHTRTLVLFHSGLVVGLTHNLDD